MSHVRYDCTDPRELSAEAEDAVRRAVSAGECIVFTTDTVYGIGADAFSPTAVQGLLDAKERGRDMPPPVLIAAPEVLPALVTDLPDGAQQLVDKHWPGPLTVIGRQQPSLRLDLGDAVGTIAVRVPDDDLARAVLRITGPLAVSSANRTGREPATTCDQAEEQLGDRVSVYLDGGTAAGGVPSTIVDFTRYPDGEVLRPGALTVDELRETLPGLRAPAADG
ncbi:L-threonylcarbamoyladenylate synthase [Enemella sp. A6]|uniref:L-threonylcarbamoyladenylate synthase n=1 Tax=Enemella sp. A6 TaxID=3440152 RepID=UPI003EBFD301